MEEVAKAVGGGSYRLQMPLEPALGVRETVAGRWLDALEGRGYLLPFQCILAAPPPPLSQTTPWSWVRRNFVARAAVRQGPGAFAARAAVRQACRPITNVSATPCLPRSSSTGSAPPAPFRVAVFSLEVWVAIIVGAVVVVAVVLCELLRWLHWKRSNRMDRVGASTFRLNRVRPSSRALP